MLVYGVFGCCCCYYSLFHFLSVSLECLYTFTTPDMHISMSGFYCYWVFLIALLYIKCIFLSVILIWIFLGWTGVLLCKIAFVLVGVVLVCLADVHGWRAILLSTFKGVKNGTSAYIWTHRPNEIEFISHAATESVFLAFSFTHFLHITLGNGNEVLITFLHTIFLQPCCCSVLLLIFLSWSFCFLWCNVFFFVCSYFQIQFMEIVIRIKCFPFMDDEITECFSLDFVYHSLTYQKRIHVKYSITKNTFKVFDCISRGQCDHFGFRFFGVHQLKI